MNWYFYKIWIPLQILTVTALFEIFTGGVELDWWIIGITWFLIGPVGIGVGYHRLFSHRSFETWRSVELTLAVLGTLTAYAPVLFWTAIHQAHHRTADTEKDPSSPRFYGVFESFLTYRFKESVLKKIHIKNYCVLRILKDPVLMFLSRHFISIIYLTVFVLWLCGPFWLVNLFLIPVLIEHVRSNAISAFSHMNIPFSYRNHDTKDDSQNNVIFGFLSMGFAWHNNHHNNPRLANLREKWWELDIEGLIADALTRRK